MDSEPKSKRSGIREGAGTTWDGQVSRMQAESLSLRSEVKNPTSQSPQSERTTKGKGEWSRFEHRMTGREGSLVLAQGRSHDNRFVTLCPSPFLWLDQFCLGQGAGPFRGED